MSRFSPDPVQIASHADHIVARHVLGGMPQRVDTSRVRGIHARVEAPSSSAARPEPPTPGCRSGEAPQRLPHPSPPPARSPPRPMTTPERSHHGRRAELDAVRILAVLRLLAPSKHHHRLRLHLMHTVLVFAVQIRCRSAAMRTPPRWPPPASVARPPWSVLGRGGWLSEFERHSWCFPTPSSPPTRPQPVGTGSSGELLCFPRDQGPRGQIRQNPGGFCRTHDSYE